MAMTSQGLMLSLAGVSVAPMMAFHARLMRADIDQGAEGQHSLLEPAYPHMRMPVRSTCC